MENNVTDVTFDPEFGSLKCPQCGHEYLHLVGLVFHTRNEWPRATSRVTVSDAGLVSMRLEPWETEFRPHVALRFDCELGCGVPPLTITNHKGNTRMEWSK
jgi:hypothetical protein